MEVERHLTCCFHVLQALAWDVHFWIGKYSTQDEYGTAAYKTVELDHFVREGCMADFGGERKGEQGEL